MRESKPGDLYVVESGALSVTQAGEELRTLGPGDFFGEIALLRSVPGPRRSPPPRRASCAPWGARSSSPRSSRIQLSHWLLIGCSPPDPGLLHSNPAQCSGLADAGITFNEKIVKAS